MLIRPFRFLRNSDAAGGSGPQTAEQINAPQIGESKVISNDAAPPPVARIAVTGTKTEGELRAEAERDAAEKRARDAEVKAATVTDEFHRYKKTVETPKPAPTPKKKASWQDGIGFFKHEVED